jgi:cytochrome P450
MSETTLVQGLGGRPALAHTALGPRGHWLSGNLPEFKADRMAFLMDAVREYGDIPRFRFGRRITHLVHHPEHVRVVMQDRYQNFSKLSVGWKKLKLLLGDGLLTSDGDFWRRQRRIAQPAFHQTRIAAFARTMTDAAEEMARDWTVLADRGKPVDVAFEMMKITLTVVAKTLLGTDLQDEQAFRTVRWGIAVAIDYINRHIYRLVDVPGFVPTRGNREFHRAARDLDQLIYSIIEGRRRHGSERHDLLAMLMAARDEETGEGMTNLELRDEVMTMFLAGHETTSVALTWIWYFLATHVATARTLRAELAEVLGGRAPTLEDVPRLPFTNLVIKEVLRLYPPLWAFSRIVHQDIEIGGRVLPARSVVILSPYVTHRHPEYWDNPEGFDPRRFADEERIKSLPRFAYMPFGGGPRNCIGSAFAMLELQMLVATLAQRFVMHVQGGHSVVPRPILTLRPKGGMPMLLRRLTRPAGAPRTASPARIAG